MSGPSGTNAESFIVERQDSVFSFDADGTGYRESTMAITVQSEAALHSFGVVSFTFAANSEKVELHYVRVRRHDGTVVDTPLTDAIEQPDEVTRDAPFYSDLRQMQVPVKSLGVGDTLEWSARIVRTHSEAPGEFWGQESFIKPGAALVREESIELHVPKSKTVTVWTNPAFLAATNPVPHGPPTEKTVGEERVYRWESADLRPTTGKEANAAKEAKKKQLLTPDEELDAEQGKLPTIAWTTFPSWAAVGAWYRGLEGDRMQPDAEIKARVDELTSGKTTEEEKVRAVYAYDSSHIRYIGVAFGIGRYQPHHAEDVLNNQYGDCKDKETLLASMLEALGLHPEAALIGVGVRFNPDVPSPGAFNHLILRVQIDGKPVWLDPTTEVAPYRMLLSVLRDKPALVIPDSGPASIERTPADMPFPARAEWTSTGKLDAAGTAESHIVATFRGDDELIFRSVVRQVPAASYDELGQRIVASMGYSGKVTHVEFSRPDDTAEPERFSFDYHREKSGDWDNLRIVPQLAPVLLPTVDEKEPPIAPLDLQAPRVEHSHAELTLLEGWSAELPEAVHQKTPWVTYDMTYRLDGDNLITDRTVAVLQRKVPAADWKTYKKFQDATGLGTENFIQLTHYVAPVKAGKAAKSDARKPTVVTPSAISPTAGHITTAERQNLINEMETAFRSRDADALGPLVAEMKADGPEARRVHAWTGALAELHGDLHTALTENQKELALYPDELDRYQAIAYFEGRMNDKEGVLTTLHAWTLAAPDAPGPWLALARVTLASKQYDQSADAAQHAAKCSAEGSADYDTAELLLGEAQLRSGNKDAADKTLTALLNGTDDAGLMNDAAYELADAGLDLPLDEAKERIALSKLTAETQGWTLDETPSTLTQRSSLLAASWDTTGWILYREGRAREAYPWIVAAWINQQHTAVRDHLLKLQTALDPAFLHSAEAIDLDKGGQALRTIPLGKADGRNGVGEYRLLLAAQSGATSTTGVVERAEPIDGKTLPSGDTLIRTARLPHFFPPGSEARLVRNAMLNCHSGVCELVLAP